MRRSHLLFFPGEPPGRTLAGGFGVIMREQVLRALWLESQQPLFSHDRLTRRWRVFFSGVGLWPQQ